MLKSSPTLFALARTPGNNAPRTLGGAVVVRLLAIFGGSVRLCCRASCGTCAVFGSPDVIF